MGNMTILQNRYVCLVKCFSTRYLDINTENLKQMLRRIFKYCCLELTKQYKKIMDSKNYEAKFIQLAIVTALTAL